MSRHFGALLIAISVTGCSGINQPSEQITTAPKRDLSPNEKSALSPAVASRLKDPSAAQFRWMPVVLTERDGATDYCGLVNGKNSYGGYSGYVRFYAQLSKNDQGQFTKALVRSVEPPNREINPLDPRWLNGICEKFGYDDFSQAR